MASRIRHYVTETLLWAAAALGLIAIVLVFCAYFFNISVILFRTGSMEPTIPAGSAALVQEVEASEVEVGDVLTVERPGDMPVTHRVTSVEPADTATERVITMQGDANESPDPAPYTITEGRVLLASVPGLANPINQLGNPYVMGGITLAASILVGWAFWPRSGGGSPPARPREGSDESSSTSPKPRHAGAVVGVVAVAGVAIIVPPPEPAAAGTAEPESTEVVEETIASTFITLTSVYSPSTRQNLAPDKSSQWDVGIDVDGPSEGEVRTGLSSTGDLPLEVTMLACSSRWTSDPTGASDGTDDCASTSRVVAEDQLVSPREDIDWIDEFSTEDSPWLRLVVSLPDSADAPVASTAGLRVHAQAWGDEVSTGPESDKDQPAPSPGEETSDDDAVQPHPDATTSPSDEQTPQGGDLARTGFSLLPLLAAGVLSVVLGRWLKSRSGKSADAEKSGGAR